MNTIWKVLAGLGLVIVLALSGEIGKLVGRSSVTSYNEGKKTGFFEEGLVTVANELNKTLPMMVDRQTRLDTTIGGPGKKFTYLYTLTEHSSNDIAIQQIQEALALTIRNTACSTNEMRVFFKNGVTAVYRYRGKDGRVIGDIAVTPADCGY